MTLCATREEPKAEADRVGAYSKPPGYMMHTGRCTTKCPHLNNSEVLRGPRTSPVMTEVTTKGSVLRKPSLGSWDKSE